MPRDEGMNHSIRTIYWQDGAVVMIDQRALPLVERYVTCTDYREVISAIKDLTIRGAPAIGVAAAMGIALGVRRLPDASPAAIRDAFNEICKQFAAARPTARNLFWAIERMKRCFDETARSLRPIREALIAEAIRIGEEDIAINRRLGQNGRALIPDGARILTHCNAGALATGGIGTALGIIYTARDDGKRLRVYADETRPLLQGARLTCWELMQEGIEVTLICDSMAGFLMQQGKIDCVIVGADRIAQNGDFANKIGTYSIAVLAKEHGIPFYVAAPNSTFDNHIPSGKEIPIEERSPDEVVNWGGIRTAPDGVKVYSPAFDITPAELVTAYITDKAITPGARESG